LKNNIILYVKSEKIPLIDISECIPGHPCGEQPRKAVQVLQNYKAEDQEAIDILKEAGVVFKLVDLSICSFTTRLKAKMSRIDRTPTLVLNDRKIRGIANIKKALQEIKKQQI